MDKPIDIILATHNHLGMTIRCMEALYANTPQKFNLTIVDDSTDLTPQWVEWFKKEHDNINYLHSDTPYINGNQIINVGLKNTTSELVVYMGNSTIVEPEWLSVALPVMEQGKDVGLIGFKLLKPEGVIEHAGICFMRDMPHHMNYGVGAIASRFTHIQDMGIVGWALVLIRRIAIPEGGLDEKTYIGFRGYDDIDNCLTMSKNGWKILYCGFGVAFHYAQTTRSEADGEKIIAESEENRIRFTKKWGDLTKKVKVFDAGIANSLR